MKNEACMIMNNLGHVSFDSSFDWLTTQRAILKRWCAHHATHEMTARKKYDADLTV